MIIRLTELVGPAALQAYMRLSLGVFGFLQGKKNLGRITVGGFGLDPLFRNGTVSNWIKTFASADHAPLFLAGDAASMESLDSIDAIKLVKDDVNPFHKYSSIVLEIKEMTTRMWQVDPRMHSERVTALQIILREMQQVSEWDQQRQLFFHRFYQARCVLVVCDDVLPTRSQLPRYPSMYGATPVVATVMDHA
ncbi:hypothetical protein D5086_013741 [Populus alba]|uniref:Uncharacterized protein n=1 Tax=Populus alba TaxID=43335 RepID=A0ACC4C8J9_POPAL